MNKREKVLGIIVATVLVLCLGGAVVKWGVVDRWNGIQDDITKARQRVQSLNMQLAQARTAEANWLALRPLSHNLRSAEQRFRRDISGLLEQHGLHENLTIRTLSPGNIESSRDVKFAAARVSFQTRGTLKQVTNFLCDFYRRDYLTKLEKITLTAEDKGRSSSRTGSRRAGWRRGGRATTKRQEGPSYGPEGPNLNVSIIATALVLPQIKGLEREAITEITPPDPDDQGLLPRPIDEYAAIWETNLFKEWQPKATAKVKEPIKRDDGPKVVRKDPERKPTPPKQPRPNKKLIGVNSMSGTLIASIQDPRRRELPPERVGLNEEIDDGTLVLICPRGIVVQVEQPAGETFEFKYYVYKLGTRFEDREELDHEMYPEIAEQLELALVP